MYHRPITFRTHPRRWLKFAPGVALRSAVGNFWLLLGTGLAFLYVGRVSVFSIWAGPFKPLLQLGGQGLLVVGLVLILGKGVRSLSGPGIVFIVLTFPGVLLSDSFSQALLKWAAWALLFVLLGPVIRSDKARTVRSASWNTFRWLFVFIAIASFCWYAVGLPNLGRGAFTGVMMHSMLLGPIAAMACLFLVHRAIVTRSQVYLVFCFLALIPCLLAGSRSALLGLAAGVLVLIVFSIGRAGFKKSIAIILIAALFGGLGFVLLENVKNKNFLYRFTLELENKGMNNSREGLWSSRLSEFNRSPMVGIGVGMGHVSTRRWDGVVVDASGKINVEPGSSYLAVLSMTGVFGALGFCFILVDIFRRVKASVALKKFNPALFETLTIFAFFAVHMVVEGYIFAVGNQFCLLLWLCLGRMYDLISFQTFAKSSARFTHRPKKYGAKCLR